MFCLECPDKTAMISKPVDLFTGLCRTCEIFGVSEFVISNMRYVHDKAFQSLSVTAEKWIPIKEVWGMDCCQLLNGIWGRGR